MNQATTKYFGEERHYMMRFKNVVAPCSNLRYYMGRGKPGKSGNLLGGEGLMNQATTKRERPDESGNYRIEQGIKIKQPYTGRGVIFCLSSY